MFFLFGFGTKQQDLGPGQVRTCPGIPDNVLEPWSSWASRAEYDKKYKQLAQRFIENFAKFSKDMPREVVEAGPRI